MTIDPHPLASLPHLERMTIFEQGVQEGLKRGRMEHQALLQELEKTKAALAYAEKLLRYEKKA
jgi:hypothetical protein